MCYPVLYNIPFSVVCYWVNIKRALICHFLVNLWSAILATFGGEINNLFQFHISRWTTFIFKCCQAQPSVHLQLGWDGLYCWFPLPTHPRPHPRKNALQKLEVQTRSIVHVFKLQKWQNKNLGCHCATINDFPINNRILKSPPGKYQNCLLQLIIGKGSC